jgi:hypothetical protein
VDYPVQLALSLVLHIYAIVITRTMAPLTELPLELLNLVLENLTKSDLASLSRVCNCLRVPTEPYLYQNIVWDDHWPFDGDVIRPRPPPDALHFLLRSVTNRAELGTHIEHLVFRGPKKDILRTGRAECFTKQEMEVAKGLLEKADLSLATVSGKPVPSHASWPKLLESPSVSAMLGLLLLLSENLKSLVLDFDHRAPGSLRLPFVSNALRGTNRVGFSQFLRLTHVEFSARPITRLFQGQLTLNAAEIVGLFYLPAIKHIKLTKLGAEPIRWPSQAPLATTLRTMTFFQSRISEENLALWLSVTPRLVSLTYGIIVDVSSNSSTWLSCDMLRLAIGQVQDTIQNLAVYVSFLIVDQSIPRPGVDYGIREKIGPLKHFQNLQILTIMIPLLLGSDAFTALPLQDVLPYGLKKLCIVDNLDYLEHELWYEWETDGWAERNTVLMNFVVDYERCTPLLQELRVCILEDEANFSPEEHGYDWMIEICQQVNLDFAFEFYDGFNIHPSYVNAKTERP